MVTVALEEHPELVPVTVYVVVDAGLACTIAALVSVSYTHLRAHETVLDLVCRLLLEKKTQKKTHLTILLIQL